MWENAVKVGSKLLDEKIPDWYKKVDTESLDMTHLKNCVLGQIFGDFEIGCASIGIDSGCGIVYGLDCWNRNKDEVNSLWVKEINNRLNKESKNEQK